MTELRIFQVDAFTSRLFHGNPAAVVPLEAWLGDETMQAIALENNLSETAFVGPAPGGGRLIRWFTPRREVKLCGHATLASAHVLFEHLGLPEDALRFETVHSGPVSVDREGGVLVLDFPARRSTAIEVGTDLVRALGQQPTHAYRAGEDVMAVFESKKQVHAVEPDFGLLAAVDARGVIITAPGAGHDFVSRFFAPRFGVDEDPVTGSAHCALVPYWAARLGKRELSAHQVSTRGGEIACRLEGERVRLGGRCVTYLEGTIRV